MPKTTKTGNAKKDELPSTLQRSDKHAQQTFAKVHDSAADHYGDPARAMRCTAWSTPSPVSAHSPEELSSMRDRPRALR